MATDLDSSFSEQYVKISEKLKKRFLRKPNITEATNEFNALAIQCEHSEQPTFAGLTYIGAAKCENSVGNFLGEADYYLAAARQFMKAEMKLNSMKCYSPARENLESAISCYIQTSNKYPDNSPLRTAILMELANNLVILGHNLEAIHYYDESLQYLKDSKHLELKCLCNLLDLYVKCGKYEMALKTANQIADLETRIPENVLLDVQINRILLGLIVEPTEQTSTESLKKIFDQICSDDENIDDCFSPDLKVKLESVVICFKSKDYELLQEISADMKDFFNLQQQDLVHVLVGKLELNN